MAYAHRHHLNQKIILPQRVQNILLRPVHEEQWPKLRLLFEAVKEEIERVEDVYLNSEQDVEDLARAVENCTSKFAKGWGNIEGYPWFCICFRKLHIFLQLLVRVQVDYFV